MRKYTHHDVIYMSYIYVCECECVCVCVCVFVCVCVCVCAMKNICQCLHAITSLNCYDISLSVYIHIIHTGHHRHAVTARACRDVLLRSSSSWFENSDSESSSEGACEGGARGVSDAVQGGSETLPYTPLCRSACSWPACLHACVHACARRQMTKHTVMPPHFPARALPTALSDLSTWSGTPRL